MSKEKAFSVKTERHYRVDVSRLPDNHDILVEATFSRVSDVVDDIVENVLAHDELTIKEVDEGIGPWECHGQVGVHKDMQYSVTDWRSGATLTVLYPSYVDKETFNGIWLSVLDAVDDRGQRMFEAQDGQSIDCKLSVVDETVHPGGGFTLTFDLEVDR